MHNGSVLCTAQLSSHKGGKLMMFYGIQNVLNQNLTNSSMVRYTLILQIS